MPEPRVIVLVSANSEWKAVKEILTPSEVHSMPMGETFDFQSLTYFHGGWGKVSAATTTQYVIDHFRPDLLVNLGTCGGFEGHIARGTIILVTKTIIYDIIEQMSDPEEALKHYSTELDLSWMADYGPLTIDHYPSSMVHGPTSIDHGHSSVVRGLLVSADRDIVPSDIPGLVEKYRAVAADWESGAIAWVAKRNGVRCLILRGVTDLVGESGGEAYGNIEIFHENTRVMMKELIGQLPDWLNDIQPESATQTALFNKVDCIRLYVADLESGLAFYRDRLGHPLIWRTKVAAGLHMPGSDAELVIQTEDERQEVDITVHSADAAAQCFVDAGGTLVLPPFDIQIGRCTVVRDPWGNTLVLLDTSKGLLIPDNDGNVIGNL
jgi:nucleoside phosphorylase/predicted enzyme related to lactoylglutathione lyase